MRRAITSVLTAAAVLAGSGCGLVGEDTITVTAQFTDSVGLFPGNNVDVLGVPVGEVTGVEPRGTFVDVIMTIPADLNVPADAGALIIPPTIITDRYVELTPVWTQGPTIADGAVIPLERTRTPVEFDRIVRALDTLATSLTEDARTIGAVQDALGVAARNLKGNGGRINRGIEGLAAAVNTLAGNRTDLTALIGSLDSLTETFARNDATIRDFGRNVADATEVLADNGALLSSTVEALGTALAEVGEFVRTNSDATRSGVRALTDVLAVLNEHQGSLAEAVDVLPLTLQNLERAVDPDLARVVFNASAAANLLNPVVAQQICDALPDNPACAALPRGALAEMYGARR